MTKLQLILIAGFSAIMIASFIVMLVLNTLANSHEFGPADAPSFSEDAEYPSRN